jgi:hypothetical protein
MSLEEYRQWMQRLKSEPICESLIEDIRKAMRFSPEKFIKARGIEDSFVAEFQKDRKELHTRLLDHKRITELKKRKVKDMPFRYGGVNKIARVCVCVKKMQNETHRAKGGYKFYEGIRYNYSFADGFNGEQDIFIFDERGNKVYTTLDEFERHFADIREFLIDQILDI